MVSVNGKGEVIVPPRAEQFVHLHLHSEYSLLDGGNRMDKLVRRVKALGMTSVAVTDHGNLFGAMSFYEKAKAEGIKPILGCEAYVAPGDRHDKMATGVMDGGYHLVLLAETLEGWNNLLYLASEAYLTGFYYKPRMDHALLRERNAGLIAINGHLGSELAFHLVEYEKTKDRAHWKRAVEVATWHRETFAPTDAGPRFFVELQHHIPEQNAINPHLIALAEALDLPLVCDNDAHFLLKEDHDAHDSLICISMGKIKSDPNRFHYPHQLYVKSPREMRSMFEEAYGDVGREACDNTVRIAERCNVDIPMGNHAPVVRIQRSAEDASYDGERNVTEWYKRYSAQFELEPYESGAGAGEEEQAALESECDRALRELCEAGLIWRYGPEVADDCVKSKSFVKGKHKGAIDPGLAAKYRSRLERELKILSDKRISAYFLIVWDFVNWARQRGIPANARGSGVGTMVGYLLGLSNACPVQYGLLFERFTDPDRSEYPDIDIDLCQDGRAEVINYVREKYGHVAQIITFGTLKARAAIRDIGRVMDIPLPEVDKVAKLIPEQLKMTLAKALEEEPDLKALYDNDPQVKRVIDTGKVLEGQARHCSVHAAGVIVATRPLHEIVPLYKAPGSDDIVTQWDGPTCERVGLLKMDFLGLRTLSTIERAKTLIRESMSNEAIWKAIHHGRDLPPEDVMDAVDPLDLERLTFDDQRVFEMFRLGDTTGVFQFESGGMRRLLTEMKPDRLEDLIAANALFRPGPMDLIPDYNARKHGHEAVPKVHEIVDRFTAETYGVMVYQEQVMQIVHELGDIPLRAAYTLIKAISKKKHSVIDANRPKFIEGATEKGLSKQGADELFELILKFAGYGFNKSHSSGYAIVAYQTAFLKTYFPNQYMAAFLTYESQAQKVEDWIKYKDDCRRTRFVDGRVGVDVMPPDINLSDADFTVVYEDEEPRDALHGHIRFGLKAIKGVGAKAIEAIVAERRERGAYTSLYEFCERIPPGVVNKATIESLITCGAFDSVHGREQRASMVATIDGAVAAGAQLAKDRAAGQGGLFGGMGEDEASDAPGADQPTPPLSKARPWDEATLLAREKEVLGFYVSSHPLDRYQGAIECFANCDTVRIADMNQDAVVIAGGMIKSVRPIVIRNGRSAGERMAIITFEDTRGVIDAVLFASTYKEYGGSLASDSIVFLSGRVDHSRGDPQLIVDRVSPVEAASATFATRLDVFIDADAGERDAQGMLDQVSGLVQSQPPVGKGMSVTPLRLVIRADGKRYHVESKGKCVTPTGELLGHLERIVGRENVSVRGGMPVTSAPKRGGRVWEKAGV